MLINLYYIRSRELNLDIYLLLLYNTTYVAIVTIMHVYYSNCICSSKFAWSNIFVNFNMITKIFVTDKIFLTAAYSTRVDTSNHEN